ncbi:MAG: O-antigen ligase family protein [Candidatus Eisenbacteria bacterium]
MTSRTVLSPPDLIVTRASLAGIVAALVVFGRTPDTLPQMYVSLAVLVALYLLGRGAAILDSLVSYATSPLMRVRWLFLLWAGASLLWSPHHGPSALSHLSTLVEIHLLGLIFYDSVRKLGQIKVILVALVVTAVLATAQTLISGLGTDVMRLSGVYGNPNIFAVTSLIALAALLSGINLGKGAIGQLVSYGSILVISGGIVASTSRKGVLGVPVLCLLSMAVPSLRRRGAVSTALLLTGLVVVNASGGALQRFWLFCVRRTVAVGNWFTSVGNVDGSLLERGRFLAMGAALIVKSPFLGHGLDSFYWISGEAAYTHSNYVELGVALGLVGALLYYAFHIVLLRRAFARSVRRLLGARFAILLVVLMLALDVAIVSYRMKLPSLLMIACVGWMEGPREDE